MDINQYELQYRTDYDLFAKAITRILNAAISAESGFRLQQISHRAKLVKSLRKKLEDRKLLESTVLEEEIKDLAGCRIVFYTNSDVSKFIHSDIMHRNFEVLEVKIHHPRINNQDPIELYISNHYVVRLLPERIALPDFARFAGMRCEVQIQTILNHAWAEMAHDTIYKAPELDNFGTAIIANIKERMANISQKYLVPAGYEFQKIASDFERLIDGKSLFDDDVLEAIVNAEDNNARADALESFAESVLPLYDNLQDHYAHIVTRLLAAADRASEAPVVPIETPYGVLPAKTNNHIFKAIAKILDYYRYLDPVITFQALCELYAKSNDQSTQKILLQLGSDLAKHNIAVWRNYGPAIQAMLIEQIKSLNDSRRCQLFELLVELLKAMLGVEVTGTSSNSSTVTFHQGTVATSDELRAIRDTSIALLKHLFALGNDEQRNIALHALQSATRLPMRGHDNSILQMVLGDAARIVQFHSEIAADLTLDERQRSEEWVHHLYNTFESLPANLRVDEGVKTATDALLQSALAFRDVVNQDGEYVIFKVLVGFNSVFPPAWATHDFNYEQVEHYRRQQLNGYLDSIDASNADVWFARVNRFAAIESSDHSTFPLFCDFLEGWAKRQPAFFLSKLDSIEGSLVRFLPCIFSGLMSSDEGATTYVRICQWIDVGKDLEQIAWYLRSAHKVESALVRRNLGGLFRRTLLSAEKNSNLLAIRNVLIAAEAQYAIRPSNLIKAIFLRALKKLSAEQNYSWLKVPWLLWRGNPLIKALSELEAEAALDALVPYPQLEYATEDIAADIAVNWPKLVLNFLSKRLAFAASDVAPPRYDAIPFAPYSLKESLAAVPDILVDVARSWYESDSNLFIYDGGRFIAAIFPDISGIDNSLNTMIARNNEEDTRFAIALLSCYEGKSCIYPFIRLILESCPPGHPLLKEIRLALGQSGVVSGFYGYVTLLSEREARLEPWRTDNNENVRQFATKYIHDLEQDIASEARRAEASNAMRKLNYGEDLEDPNSGETQ